MNSALLREREQFKKKAAAIPVVEKRQNTTTELNDQGVDKKRKLNAPSKAKHHNFAALAKVVQYLRTKWLKGDKKPVSLEEILKETKQSDINPNVKSWLFDDALRDNPKISVVNDNFVFKVIYDINDKKSLVKLLKNHELNGLGGILRDDVMESLPNAENILKNLEKCKKVTVITRSSDRKKILFCRDPTDALVIDMDFKKLWNTIAVDALDENKISNYLDEQGLSFMKGEEFKRPIACQRGTKRKRQGKKPKDNAHLADVLESYDDNTLTQKGSH